MAADADCRACVVYRAQINTCLAYLRAAQDPATNAADILGHVAEAIEILTTTADALELRPSLWKGMKAVPKGEGKGKDKGKGKDGEVRARSRSPVPDWVAVAGGDQMPVTPPAGSPPAPQTPPDE